MFQYTTETIINSNEGKLSYWDATLSTPADVTDKRIAAIDSTVGSDGKVAHRATNDTLVVDGVNLFKKANITKIYRKSYLAAANEAIVVTVPDPTPSASVTNYVVGDVLRLAIKLQQEGLTSSIYADAQRLHKKPFYYEITVETASKAGVAAQFVKAIKKEMEMTDFNFFVASADSSNNLVLAAKDCYTRFEVVEIARVPVDTITSANFGNVLTGYQDFVALQSWKRTDGVSTSAAVNGVLFSAVGTEGAGTVARLIKNLRIPTDANTNPFGPDMGGKPVPGGTYDQWTIEYTTDRRHIGGQVVGALDQSLTTHIIFANGGVHGAVSGLVAGSFSKALYDAIVSLGLPAGTFVDIDA